MTDSPRAAIKVAVLALVSQATVPLNAAQVAKLVNATRGIAAWTPLDILLVISNLVASGELAWDGAVNGYITVK